MTFENGKVTAVYSLLFYTLLRCTLFPLKCRTLAGFTKSCPELTKAISEFKNKRTTEDALNLKLDLNSETREV